MTQAVEIGAMIKIPVEVLGSNYKELLQDLTMVNPKYSSAKRHGFGKVSASIPEYLYFYELDQKTRSIYVPRNYKNLSKYLGNFSLIDKTVKGKKIGKGCTAKLRNNQEQFFNKLVYPYINNINNNKINKDILINASCGSGKCHGKGTKILMYDGAIKNVEDIKVGDLLMGDDSTPRKVLSLATGKEEMFLIEQKSGENYVVNKSHILSLQKRVWGINTISKRYSDKFKSSYGEVVNISVEDYLQLSNTKKSH